MSISTIQQKEEIDASTTYTDALVIANAESSAINIEDDLNYIRTGFKNILGSANWFDAVPVGSDLASLVARTDLANKKIIKDSEVQTDISVGGADNWVVLNVVNSEAPTLVAAIGVVTTEGAITALLPAGSGTHSLNEVVGLNSTNPKNLVKIVDGNTGDPILSGGKEIWGLLQIESVALDGDAFDDTTKQGQISFVIVNGTNDDLIACPAVDIQGKVINYLYRFRTNLNDVNEQHFSGGNFTDQVASVDVTLDNAIDNQSGPATQVQNIDVRISDTFEWQYSDSAGNGIATIKATAAGDTFEVGDGVNAAKFIGFGTGEFKDSVIVDSSGQVINIGVTAGKIDSTALLIASTTGDLTLDGNVEINFIDSRQTTAIPLTDASNASLTGSPTSIYDAINNAAASGGFSLRADANTTTSVSANTLLAGPGAVAVQNLSGDLIDYTGKSFINDVIIFVNGRYQRPGIDAAANNDVYPATVAGDIIAGAFYSEKNVKNAANIMMIVK